MYLADVSCGVLNGFSADRGIVAAEPVAGHVLPASIDTTIPEILKGRLQSGVHSGRVTMLWSFLYATVKHTDIRQNMLALGEFLPAA